MYQREYLPTVAFVVPTNQTKQAFDDIGFIVVNDEEFKGLWLTAELFDSCNRTDNAFHWFAELNLSEESYEHKVVGYATQKGLQRLKSAERQYNLTELEVVVNINLCRDILPYNNLIKGFNVPCYHSCSVKKFRIDDARCRFYHGVEGSAVVNMKTNKVLGITTWGAHYSRHKLPVGFSVPNSKNYYEDYTCARRIRQDKGLLVADGYYQALCEDIN